jgi:small subunit ribosomal protein S20
MFSTAPHFNYTRLTTHSVGGYPPNPVAQHPSAEKRNRQSQLRKARNAATRSRMRTAVKAARTALESKAANKDELLKKAVADINRAASKNVVKKGTASRHVSRLMKAAGK